MKKYVNLSGAPRRLRDGTYQVEPKFYISIDEAIAVAIEVARDLKALVQFEFNEVIVTVAADSHVNLIMRDCYRAQSGYIDKRVGPYPSVTLSADDLANDQRIASQQAAVHSAKESMRQSNTNAARATLYRLLQNAPSTEVSNQGEWQRITTGQHGPTHWDMVEFAEAWARLMQAEMSRGKQLKEIARPTSLQANVERLSGQRVVAAMNILTVCWRYGAELRAWYQSRSS
jgi:hypothetical protein